MSSGLVIFNRIDAQTQGRYVGHRTDMPGCRVHNRMMDAINPDTHVRALHEAALLLGGEQKLAEFLDIEVWLVSRWLEGLGQPPDFIFSRCMDLIESGNTAAVTTKERGGVGSCM